MISAASVDRVNRPRPRRPYGSTHGHMRTRMRALASVKSVSPTTTRRQATSIAKWAGGILTACFLAAATYWLGQYGEDTWSDLRQEPVITPTVRIEYPQSYFVAFAKGPLTKEDFVKLRLSSDPQTLVDLVNSYDGARAESLSAQIVLTGGRSELTVLDIAVREVTRRAEPLTGGLVLKTSEGANASIPIRVNLDLPKPQFEVKDKPGVRYFSTETIKLERKETVTLEVEFVAATGYHEFDLEVIYLIDGKLEKAVITGPDHGVFKLSGVAADDRAYRGEVYTFGSGGGSRITTETACAIFTESQGCR